MFGRGLQGFLRFRRNESPSKPGVSARQARFDSLFCAPLSVGQFGTDEERGRRPLRVPCYETAGSRTTIHGRPIEGLFAIVDLNAAQVLRVIDLGIVPAPPGTDALGEVNLPGIRPPALPVIISAPRGGNTRIVGHEVAWDNWRFHLKLDRRFGPVLPLVRWAEDNLPPRLVLYQGYASEMSVPYMDTSEAWYYRSYMDIGEYGFGERISALEPGTDCPRRAAFLDATLPDEAGKPALKQRAFCLFERPTGAPAWRHAEPIDASYEGRPEIELVARAIPTVGNHDYVMNYVFSPKGEIRIEVGATGMDAVKGVRAASMTDPGASDEAATGMLVAPGRVGSLVCAVASGRLIRW